MKCPSCGFENEDGAKFCQSCGGNMEEARIADIPGEVSAHGTPPPPPPPRGPSRAPGSVNIDIGGWMSKAFSEVFSDIGNYLLFGLVVGLLSAITAGILGGPMLGGGLVVVRRKLRGEGQIDIGQVFNIGFEKFLPTFVLVFIPTLIVGILCLIPVIGAIIGIVVGGLLGPFWVIALHYVMEENMDFMDAGKKSVDILMKNPMMFWLFGLVAGIISGIGSIACGIGVIVTMPVGFVMLALMVESIFPKK